MTDNRLNFSSAGAVRKVRTPRDEPVPDIKDELISALILMTELYAKQNGDTATVLMVADLIGRARAI